MLYDSYLEKMKRKNKQLSFFKKTKGLFITLGALVIAGSASFVALDGTVLETNVGTSYVYGDTIEGLSKTLIGNTTVEFTKKGKNAWTPNVPTEVGTYLMRGVGETIFKTKRYSNAKEFSIEPKNVTFTISQSDITYGDRLNLSASGLLEAHSFSDTYEYEVKDVQAQSSEVSIVKESIKIMNGNNDVTHNYNVTVTPKTVNFIKRNIEITLTANDGSPVVYDGLDHSLVYYNASNLAEGDTIIKNESPVAVNVGTYSLETSFTIKNKEGIDVSNHYNILSNGTPSVEITHRPLSLTSNSKEKVFDGHPFSENDLSVSLTNGTSLAEGHRLVTEFAYLPEANENSKYLVNTYENAFTYKVVDANNVDVTSNYGNENGNITVEFGTLQINKKPVNIDVIYDEVYNTEVSVTDDGSLVEGFDNISTEISDINKPASKDNVSLSIKDDNGNDVTNCYEIISSFAFAEITDKTPLTVRPDSVNEIYDGNAHNAETFQLTGELRTGHSLKVVHFTSVSQVGTYDNEFEVQIVEDETAIDVTKLYDITYENCEDSIVISQRKILVNTYIDDQLYEGNEIEHTDDFTYSGVVEGHTFNIDSYKSTLDPVENKYVNSVDEWSVLDEDGNDVSNNYKVELDKNEFDVTKRRIAVNFPGYNDYYDGKEHTIEGSVLPTLDSILDEDELYVGSPVKVKDANEKDDVYNKPSSIYVRNKETKLRNENYVIDEAASYFGRMTVKRLPITIKVQDVEATYNGQDTFKGNEFEVTEGELAEGDEIKVTQFVSSTFACSKTNNFECTIENNHNDVTNNYDISLVNPNGSFLVKQATLVVTTETLTFEYDGNPHRQTNNVAFETDAKDEIIFDYDSMPSVTEPLENDKTVENSVDFTITKGSEGLDRSANYKITRNFGSLKVDPTSITIKSEKLEAKYDGDDHSYVSGEIKGTDTTKQLSDKLTKITSGALASTDSVKITFGANHGSWRKNLYPTQVDEPTIEFFETATPTKGKGHCYSLTYISGEINILTSDKEIELHTRSYTKTFDNAEFTVNHTFYDDLSNVFVEGDKLVYTDKDGNILENQDASTFIGVSKSCLDKVKDVKDTKIDGRSGVDNDVYYKVIRKVNDKTFDVTDCYYIDTVFGKVEVNPVKITVNLKPKQVQYDGNRHTFMETTNEAVEIKHETDASQSAEMVYSGDYSILKNFVVKGQYIADLTKNENAGYYDAGNYYPTGDSTLNDLMLVTLYDKASNEIDRTNYSYVVGAKTSSSLLEIAKREIYLECISYVWNNDNGVLDEDILKPTVSSTRGDGLLDEDDDYLVPGFTAIKGGENYAGRLTEAGKYTLNPTYSWNTLEGNSPDDYNVYNGDGVEGNVLRDLSKCYNVHTIEGSLWILK